MRVSSLIGHAVEALELLPASTLPPDAVLNRFFRERRYLGSRDRRFVAETFYGVLRHRRLCDHLLGTTEQVLSGVTDEGRELLRVAAFRLAVEPGSDVRVSDFMETIGDEEDALRFRSALERLSARGMPEEASLPLDVRYSFEEWMVSRFTQDTGAKDPAQLLASLNLQAPLSIRVNTLQTSVDECGQRLGEEGIPVRAGDLVPTSLTVERRVNVFSLDPFRRGWFEVQDEGSQALVHLIDPKPTYRVLDMCAGAGGKTLAMAAIMKNRGEIVATDVSPYRLRELRRRMRRAGAGNIRVQEDFLQRQVAEAFDVVLVDAPCTGVGTIRRNPGMKWSVSEKMVSELAAKQRGILRQASGYVKEGGLLVYATCSLFREENEDVVGHFLREQPDFAPEPISRKTVPGERATVTPEGYGMFLPHIHNTDGFFVAFLRRSGVSGSVRGAASVREAGHTPRAEAEQGQAAHPAKATP